MLDTSDAYLRNNPEAPRDFFGTSGCDSGARPVAALMLQPYPRSRPFQDPQALRHSACNGDAGAVLFIQLSGSCRRIPRSRFHGGRRRRPPCLASSSVVVGSSTTISCVLGRLDRLHGVGQLERALAIRFVRN